MQAIENAYHKVKGEKKPEIKTKKKHKEKVGKKEDVLNKIMISVKMQSQTQNVEDEQSKKVKKDAEFALSEMNQREIKK